MEKYKVSVHTSTEPDSGSYATLRLALIGTRATSQTFTLGSGQKRLTPASICSTTVTTQEALGSVLLVRLCLEPRAGFPDLGWRGWEVQVLGLSCGGSCETQRFPCDRWLHTADGDIELCNDHVCTMNSETLQILRDHRSRELKVKQKRFRWHTFAEGVPLCVELSSVHLLPPDLCYLRQSPGTNLLYLRGFADRVFPWSSLEELDTVFTHNCQNNPVAMFVRDHWRKDSFFGYQCLNGCNPLMVRRVQRLPHHLCVTCDMVRPFLPEGSSLEQELKRGTLFLLDYEVLHSVPANVVNDKQQHLAAPLCLLHYNHQGELKPIAIQLQQTPGPANPVFVPSDSEADWLLAKMWVRCADFQCHQLISHLLRTHLVGEVLCIATLRQLPEAHPLYQLLMPHVKTALQINIQARESLLAPGGVFDKYIACGLSALPVLLRRAAERLRYSNLCVPDDLQQRGVSDLPTSYYAEDALRVWAALHRFVMGFLDVYYPSHSDVCQDSELQAWIQEICTQGFMGITSIGFPQTFHNKDELGKFVTMVIYSCSAQHSAVNFSQIDFNLWMPNCPPTMRRPPPQAKGSVTEEDLLSYLPDVNATCSVLITLSLLSQPAKDFIRLGHYRERHFQTGAPLRLVQTLQKELRKISAQIAERNLELNLPYPYLSPEFIENSVTI